MTATREEIDRWRTEDGLEPWADDTLGRIFADWRPLFGQGVRIPMFDPEFQPGEYERQELLDAAPSLDSGDYFEEIGYDH